MRLPACFDDSEAKKMIKSLCKLYRIDEDLLVDLVEVVQQYSGSGRREGINSDITSALDRFTKEREEG